ncbi:unnamed protein product [Owenia fusiformis]|uniref:Uncharacterized protein n=1 Tax=Owenia fusiformis TaxID=6347 RepID=A0A8J1UWM0_OWEFU|nr:unnamed protein product [Owenia fusiformis]
MYPWLQSTLLAAAKFMGNIIQSRLPSSYVERYTVDVLQKPDIKLTDVEITDIANAAEKLKEAIVQNASKNEIHNLVVNVPNLAHILGYRDNEGYNALQHAVIVNRADIVSYLIEIGSDINNPICGRPLHLACKLGHLEIINKLLRLGADTNVISCVCYPEKHKKYEYRYNEIMKNWSKFCHFDVYSKASESAQFDYPVYYAIASGRVQCLKLLLEEYGCDTELMHDIPMLHIACALGSYQCMKYFCKNSPGDINRQDNKGLYPIHYALAQGKAFAEFLVLQGASVQVKTPQKETLLHVLYKNCNPFHPIAEITEYLLSCGLHMNINTADSEGNTALNVLLRYVHIQAEYLVQVEGVKLIQKRPETYDDELIRCINLLLDANANPNIINKQGNTAMHVLMDTPEMPQAQPSLYLESMRPPHGEQRFNHPLALKIMVLLINNGSNPNYLNKKEKSVVDLLLLNGFQMIFLKYSPRKEEVDIICQMLVLLHGKGFNYSSQANGLLPHKLLEYFNRVENHYVSLLHTHNPYFEGRDLFQEYASSLYEILQVLLNCGCDPNTIPTGPLATPFRPPNVALEAWYFKFVNCPSHIPFHLVKNIICLFLRFGANPQMGLPWPPILYHATAMLSSGQYDRYKPEEWQEIINIVFTSTCPGIKVEAVPPKPKIMTDRGKHQPRSLKQLSRSAIYLAMRRRLAGRVEILPIPEVLKDYLLSFEA